MFYHVSYPAEWTGGQYGDAPLDLQNRIRQIFVLQTMVYSLHRLAMGSWYSKRWLWLVNGLRRGTPL
jgi:hypothetical protein